MDLLFFFFAWEWELTSGFLSTCMFSSLGLLDIRKSWALNEPMHMLVLGMLLSAWQCSHGHLFFEWLVQFTSVSNICFVVAMKKLVPLLRLFLLKSFVISDARTSSCYSPLRSITTLMCLMCNFLRGLTLLDIKIA